jgi:hypothetical protein
MTDQELHEYATDHLCYELSMLYETARRLVYDRAIHTDCILKNALIESFTIHARALVLFLYRGKQRADDVTAEQYVKDVDAWGTTCGPIPSELQAVIDRTGKEIAHLTTGRLPAGDPKKGWSPEPIFREFFEPLRRFAAHVPPARLDASVVAFIGALPAAPAPGSVPPPAAAPTALPTPVNSGTPTGMIIGGTSVSTP